MKHVALGMNIMVIILSLYVVDNIIFSLCYFSHMLTGIIQPSAGTAYINGYDIISDHKGARKSLGFCPQHDVLIEQ